MKTNRRNFFQWVATGCVAAVCSSRFAWASTPTPKPVDMNDALVKGLGYVANADSVKDEKRTKATGPKQYCWNCALYKGYPNDQAKVGSCALFQNNLVAANGWCKSWVLKPNAKAPA